MHAYMQRPLAMYSMGRQEDMSCWSLEKLKGEEHAGSVKACFLMTDKKEMAQLQENINGITAAFYTCARSDSNCSPLSREELRQLIEQFTGCDGGLAGTLQDPKTIKKVLCFLDDNSNCSVVFTQDTETQHPASHQIQEGETQEQDQDTDQTQERETAEQDQDTHQDDGTEAPEGDPERAEILDTATPEQDKNTHKAEETEAPKQDPKTHQAQETEAPGQGSNHHQSPETESAEQNLNCPSETRGRDPNNKTQVCKALWQDRNPSKTQKLLPPQWGASPHWDPKPQETCHNPTCHQLPESKVLEQKHSRADAPSCPAQQQQDAPHQRQPTTEQQLLQSLYISGHHSSKG
ncbi:uncharacterized protein LOC128146530 [Harpia harpyja]|uniref:uncharacterized protein LOC128146530 n=1 Tax=Harpia harpyja TaxID=202280 RepID=UPI0022B20AA8|nr:uncharacterized protein LOC128146530 [Harpia harpyja]